MVAKPASTNGASVNGRASYTWQAADGSPIFVRTYKVGGGVGYEQPARGRRPLRRGLQGITKFPPYKLPALLTSDPASALIVVFHEADAETLAELGIAATVLHERWSGEDHETFNDRQLGFLLHQGDKWEAEEARRHAELLKGHALNIEAGYLPGWKSGRLADWLADQPESWERNHLLAAVYGYPVSLEAEAEADDQGGVDEERPAPDPLKWIDDGDVATLADVRREIGETRYLWDKWIPFGAMTAVIAEGGLGKTRTVLDWALRLWLGEPMPDGNPNPLPAGTKTLWLCYDRHWWGLIDTAKAFGLPESAILLPTRKGRPLWIPDFDHPETMTLLERLIRIHKPGFVAVDTTTYATAFNTAKANETKLAFDPIMGVMAETKTACLALTHVSREGTILNRRLAERTRVVIKLTQPDPNQKNRLKIAVDKSDDRKPAPLGLTFTDGRNEYDDRPPEPPQHGTPGPKTAKTAGMAEWLWSYLQSGPAPMVDIINAARDAELLKLPTAKEPKPSITSLYDAMRRIPRLYPGHEIEQFSCRTERGKELQHWKIVEARPTDAEAEEGDQCPF